MLTRGFILGLALLFALGLFGQNTSNVLEGEVTFITSKNVYVKFENTARIQLGDTLFITVENAPQLVVMNKSTTSCVCVPVGKTSVAKGDKVIFLGKNATKVNESPDKVEPAVEEPVEDKAAPRPEALASENEKTLFKERIRGRISASSYHNIASARDDRNRFMSRFWLDAGGNRDLVWYPRADCCGGWVDHAARRHEPVHYSLDGQRRADHGDL